MLAPTTMTSLEFSSSTSVASSPPSEVEAAFTGGLSDPNSTQYKHRRHVLDIVNTLHSYGLQRQLDLPQIAVVGSQSVGKSSLIESISGITLPRAKGTCTRCPIECRLSKIDVDWSCEVYLRRADKIGDIEFGPRMYDKSEVEERIRRAQLAILNPSAQHQKFLEAFAFPERNEVSFSTDLISVRISGRDVDDLSFVDLPGVIQSVREGGREADIQEVKNLVSAFIKKPSCLILLVVSCETDIENQGARQLAKQVDPSGERTIPVLTKPDRIAAGEESTWLALLQNQQEKFKHGWHCVKQLDQTQLDQGITWADARLLESDFFDTRMPWARLDEAVRSRLGTTHLTTSLGATLFALICKRLPSLLKEVDATLTDTKAKLAELPPKLEGEPISIVFNLVDQFKTDVSNLIMGRAEDGYSGLVQTFRRHSEQFNDSIFRQAPCFRPFPTPASSQDVENDSGEYPPTVKDEEKLEPTGKRNPATFIYFDKVLEMARNARTRELPNNTPFAVKKYYIDNFTGGWQHPAETLFREMERRLSNDLKSLVAKHFSNFSTGGLESTVLQIISSNLSRCSATTLEKINDCVALEKNDPFTSNARDMQEYKSKFVDLYREVRREHLKVTTGHDDGMLEEAKQALQQLGFALKIDILSRLIAPDEADEAIEIMAEVRSYYQVAYKRFVDYVPMIIDYNLFKGFHDTLVVALTKGLQLGQDGSARRCATYLMEDALTEHKRNSLTRVLERFGNARGDLQTIPGVPFMVDVESDGSEGVEDN